MSGAIPIQLTEAQRRAVAVIAPELSTHLRLNERGGRTVAFEARELEAIRRSAQGVIQQAPDGMKRNTYRHIIEAIGRAIENAQGLGAIPRPDRLYQFRISLLDVEPRIWRRIQVRDCTLDKLHVRIQTAMGWTNSHLHHFCIREKLYGDPLLLGPSFVELDYEDSTITRVSEVLPRSGERFRFVYEYDFGDSWVHEVLFEGGLRAESGQRYPLCLEGERACPPEDIGGVGGYEMFLEAIADPEHEEHGDYLEWAGEGFDPEAFDAALATKRMRSGLPNWRELE